MIFRDQVIEYLGNYRKTVIGISDPGIYWYCGNAYQKEHILPTGDLKKRLNILDPYRDDFYKSHLSNISFHRYFHHLNSSQALCINLFYPLIKEQIFGIFLRYIGVTFSIVEYAFEKESPIEQVLEGKRKTNFDFYIQSDTKESIFFEIKYTENGFNRVEDDEEHIEKYKFTYKKLLDNNPYIHNDFKNMNKFFRYYQILRNLVHIRSGSIVVFLFPQQNKIIDNQALFARESILTDLGRKAFRIIYLEDIINYIEENIESQLLLDHYSQFREKYLYYSV
jgi:hypothetical protein